MRFSRLQWLFPLAVTLHNSEEAIFLPRWVAAHSAQLPFVAGAKEIRFALAVLTLAAFAVTYLSHRKGSQSIAAYLTFGYIAAMLANVFVPHVPASLLYRGYVPGVLTAVFINLPVMSFLLFAALRDQYVSGRRALGYGVAVPVAMGGLIPALFLVGRIL